MGHSSEIDHNEVQVAANAALERNVNPACKMLEGVYDRTQRITTLNSIATETNGLRMRAGKEDVNFLEFGDEKGGYAANEYTPRTDSKTASLWLSTEHGAIGHTLIREEYDDAGKLKTSTCSK